MKKLIKHPSKKQAAETFRARAYDVAAWRDAGAGEKRVRHDGLERLIGLVQGYFDAVSTPRIHPPTPQQWLLTHEYRYRWFQVMGHNLLELKNNPKWEYDETKRAIEEYLRIICS